MIRIQYRVEDYIKLFMGLILEVMLCECCANIHCFTLFKTHPNINSAFITGKTIRHTVQENNNTMIDLRTGCFLVINIRRQKNCDCVCVCVSVRVHVH